MSAAAAYPSPTITVDIRPARGANETRMIQAQWSRELRLKWRNRTHMPGDRPAIQPSLENEYGEPEERSGIQVGKAGYDAEGARHEPLAIGRGLWQRAHHLLVDALLEESAAIVATLPDMPDAPVGWAVYQAPTIHFVFVMPAARRGSIATQLVLSTRCSRASHMTPDGRGLARLLRGTA